MDTIKAANKVIKEGIALLADDMKGDFKAQASDIFIDEAINNACGALNENEEKIAMLRAYAVQEANRVASTLWREGLITPEYEKEYRALPSMKEMADAYNVFTDERKGRMDEVMADHKVIADEERELDIFKGIINGIPAEESEKRYDEYRQQQQAAMAGGR
ncbi:MAG: hypothetical protein U0L97_02225 [Candidatus Saccharimonadaceae bacterium]|jgi:hypothetical protein|nr:hypothetical protein [Candidatus Saccharimonadaceae bacterium]